jgi:hypothetical protein
MQDKSKRVSWCLKKGSSSNDPINWASGQLAADGCMAITLSNSSVNASTLTLLDCTTPQYFVCEVYKSHFWININRRQIKLQQIILFKSPETLDG